jgi:hypothetical protein
MKCIMLMSAALLLSSPAQAGWFDTVPKCDTPEVMAEFTEMWKCNGLIDCKGHGGTAATYEARTDQQILKEIDDAVAATKDKEPFTNLNRLIFLPMLRKGNIGLRDASKSMSAIGIATAYDKDISKYSCTAKISIDEAKLADGFLTAMVASFFQEIKAPTEAGIKAKTGLMMLEIAAGQGKTELLGVLTNATQTALANGARCWKRNVAYTVQPAPDNRFYITVDTEFYTPNCLPQ